MRLDAALNGGEASVLVSGVHLLGGGQLAADLAPDGLAAQQASEVGISHAGLLRNLVNAALLRADMERAERQSAATASSSPATSAMKPSKGRRGGKKAAAAAAAGGESASDSDGEEPRTGSEEPFFLGPRLAPLPPPDIYAGAPLFPVAPDGWDLLLSLKEPREEEEIREVADEAELEDHVDEVWFGVLRAEPNP